MPAHAAPYRNEGEHCYGYQSCCLHGTKHRHHRDQEARTLKVSVFAVLSYCGSESASSAEVMLVLPSLALSTATGLSNQWPAAVTNLPPALLLAKSPAPWRSRPAHQAGEVVTQVYGNGGQHSIHHKAQAVWLGLMSAGNPVSCKAHHCTRKTKDVHTGCPAEAFKVLRWAVTLLERYTDMTLATRCHRTPIAHFCCCLTSGVHASGAFVGVIRHNWRHAGEHQRVSGQRRTRRSDGEQDVCHWFHRSWPRRHALHVRRHTRGCARHGRIKKLTCACAAVASLRNWHNGATTPAYRDTGLEADSHAPPLQ